MPIDKDKAEELQAMIDQSIQKALSGKVVPDGYTRCKKCGALIQDGKACPYCLAGPDGRADDGDII
jgi:hypothetical protein